MNSHSILIQMSNIKDITEQVLQHLDINDLFNVGKALPEKNVKTSTVAYYIRQRTVMVIIWKHTILQLVPNITHYDELFTHVNPMCMTCFEQQIPYFVWDKEIVLKFAHTYKVEINGNIICHGLRHFENIRVAHLVNPPRFIVESMSMFLKLRHLALSNMNFRVLPLELTFLRNLRSLSILNNVSLTTIPEDYTVWFPHLKTLSLDNCAHLKKLHPSVLSKLHQSRHCALFLSCMEKAERDVNNQISLGPNMNLDYFSVWQMLHEERATFGVKLIQRLVHTLRLYHSCPFLVNMDHNQFYANFPILSILLQVGFVTQPITQILRITGEHTELFEYLDFNII